MPEEEAAAPAEEAPAAEEPAEPATPATDDPFSTSTSGQLPVRQWVDNTGGFRISGRLLLILDGKVRILKETGRTTTVPFERLSDGDREYVEQIISRYGKDLKELDRLAAR